MDVENISGTDLPKILCCECGIVITSNPANMCPDCLASVVDITEDIPRKYNLGFCPESGRYFQPPNRWVQADLESPTLLSLCLKQIRGLNKVRLVDAGFVWTEPHSRRIKVRLTIQKEIFDGLVLEQTFVVEFVVIKQQSPEVQASYTAHTWKAAVQVRQRVNHKRTIFLLEQIILKHKAFEKVTNVKEMPDGIDFFFAHRGHALQFLDFVCSVVPCRTKDSKELISHDASSNTFNYKYTFKAEVIPICKDDLVVLPPKLFSRVATASPLLLCSKISGLLHLVDPFTTQTVELDARKYWRDEFHAVANAAHLQEFMIFDTEPTQTSNGKWALYDMQLARSDAPAEEMFVHSHLGNILHPGDLAWGYDLRTLNYPEDVLNAYRHLDMPDVILVRKSFADREKRRKKRFWKLKRLAKEYDEGTLKQADKDEADYERFIEELEEDPEMRSNVAMFKDPEFIPREDEETEDEDGLEVPMVGLDELIDTMTGMAIDEDGEGDEAEAALYGEGDVVPVGGGLSEDATPSDQEEF